MFRTRVPPLPGTHDTAGQFVGGDPFLVRFFNIQGQRRENQRDSRRALRPSLFANFWADCVRTPTTGSFGDNGTIGDRRIGGKTHFLSSSTRSLRRFGTQASKRKIPHTTTSHKNQQSVSRGYWRNRASHQDDATSFPIGNPTAPCDTGSEAKCNRGTVEEAIHCTNEKIQDNNPASNTSKTWRIANPIPLVAKSDFKLDHVSARNDLQVITPDIPVLRQAEQLGRRLKKLSREYGWSAVGVYLALSVLDFPFCFLLVRIVGTDRIGQLEHWVVSHVQKVIPDSVKTWWTEYRAALSKAETEQLGNNDISDAVEKATWGVEEAQRANKAEASLGTQLALAYAIHKSFIFLRVPLTAAVTPKVVKVLRSWGWQIGKRRSK
ncbi:peptide alpha-N-acetyltransferase Nat2 [Colletotrichum lupini]|uniref:Peptide alpha-N-acetyltransferase Nat2 n=1 Tax=Colletotrichum lupini TaxID=145971 RepID=A0A9Q8SXC9_9PEZI|nr:peptide alpha-N-acetyltransferase Nat2 [Colletotrichum lupini]UQC85276.1 peptide alpha-N-acetyltransferase Nat2 [Colletotrichum lupini]